MGGSARPWLRTGRGCRDAKHSWVNGSWLHSGAVVIPPPGVCWELLHEALDSVDQIAPHVLRVLAERKVMLRGPVQPAQARVCQLRGDRGGVLGVV